MHESVIVLVVGCGRDLQKSQSRTARVRALGAAEQHRYRPITEKNWILMSSFLCCNLNWVARINLAAVILIGDSSNTTRPHACTDTVLQKNFNPNRQHNFNHALKSYQKDAKAKEKFKFERSFTKNLNPNFSNWITWTSFIPKKKAWTIRKAWKDQANASKVVKLPN